MLNQIATLPPVDGGFDALGLVDPICKAVRREKYVVPTPIQAQAIPHLLEGRDLLGCAQTGTGKTAAFALPILHGLAVSNKKLMPRKVGTLILTPPRELAYQINESFDVYGRYMKFRKAVVFGGVSYNTQIRSLSRGVDVLISTPGRLLDLMEQGYVHLDEVSTFVLDEADRMLDMGFFPDIRRIHSKVPPNAQTMLFSATFPKEIVSISKQFLKDPVSVSVAPPASTVEKIDQRVMFVDRENKSDLLEIVLEDESIQRCLIFTRTKHGANKIARKLEKNRIPTEALHGNKSQNARQAALKKFRSGKVRILVATDVASRGLDVDGITHVINYELPHEPESYVHRIGRTARAGASGVAISFCDAGERGYLSNIERTIKQSVEVFTDHPLHSATVASKKSRPGSSGKGQKDGHHKSSFGRFNKSKSPKNKARGPASNKNRTYRQSRAG